MKSLLVVRHAKSSWNSEELNDFDRPLNERGKRDAPMMADRLVGRDVHPDVLVSSPAKRAKKTAQLFAAGLGKQEDSIVYKTELYHAASEVFYEVIAKLPDTLDCVVIFSHNPGITAFVNGLGLVRIDDMPTCGVFAARVAIAHWKDFSTGKKEFWFFDYPKGG